MARGLAAIRARPPAPVPLRVAPEEQADADVPFGEWWCNLRFDDAVDAWKRRDTADAIELATEAAQGGHHRAQELLGAIYALCSADN